MKKRKLGNTGLELTELGFGGGAIGGLYRAVSREAAFETMDAAWASGMRYFDTAPFYGFGLSERRVGDFLRDKPRDEFVLSSKVGKILSAVPEEKVPDFGFVNPLPFDVHYDYSYDGIMRSYEFSLARLGLNRIDILYVHDLEAPSLGLDEYRRHFRIFMDSGIRALDELKAAGAIKAFGLGVNDVGVCLDVLSRDSLDCILLAGRYTLLDRTASARLLGVCEKAGTSLVIGGVFNSGILATGAVPGAFFNYEPPSDDIVNRVNAMRKIAEDDGVSLAATALQFPLRNSSVASILIGTAKPSSLTRNIDLLSARLPEESWAQFDSVAVF
ncbi:aldo/keto reductase [Agrobacterium rhizogenes]|nr:aldo/keto reductase [Rhizobium rhizogenes]NTJ79411.1 aldo/keto reductase [Rhizobium rhizogenes]